MNGRLETLDAKVEGTLNTLDAKFDGLQRAVDAKLGELDATVSLIKEAISGIWPKIAISALMLGLAILSGMRTLDHFWPPEVQVKPLATTSVPAAAP